MIITSLTLDTAIEHGKHVLKVKRISNPESRDWNDHVSIVATSNLGFGSDVKNAVKEMAAVASASRCKKFLYAANINPDGPHGRELTDEEAITAVEVLLEDLGFGVEHQWILIRHLKNGRVHFHLLANRVSPETFKAVHLGWNYACQELVSRKLERMFGLMPVPGAFTCKNKTEVKSTRPRVKRKNKHRVEQQAKRTGIPIETVVSDFCRIWEMVNDECLCPPKMRGAKFAELLKDSGYVLARGNRRDFVAVDWQGGLHNPLKKLDSFGLKAAQFRKLLADLDVEQLPTVDQAKEGAKPKVSRQHVP